MRGSLMILFIALDRVGGDVASRTGKTVCGALRSDRSGRCPAIASRSTPPARTAATSAAGRRTASPSSASTAARRSTPRGMTSGGKAIWVVSGNDTTIENIEMTGATVADANGAGIRQEGKNLTVRGCYFHDNQDGILAGDAAGSTILIEHSRVRAQRRRRRPVAQPLHQPRRQAHLPLELLAPRQRRPSVEDARARVRHSLQPPQRRGRRHRELRDQRAERGHDVIVGNVIEQGPMTLNSAIIDYGSEPTGFNPTQRPLRRQQHHRQRSAGGRHVRAGRRDGDDARGAHQQHLRRRRHGVDQASAVLTANYTGMTPMFAAPASFDYHLLAGSPCVDAGHDPGMTMGGVSLAPVMEYVHPTMVEGRMSVGAIDIGAYELGGGTPLVDGGDIPIDMAVPLGVDPNDDMATGGVGAHGCGCAVGGRPSIPPLLAIALISLLFVAIRKIVDLTSSARNEYSFRQANETRDAERRGKVRGDPEGGARAVRRARLPRHAGAAGRRARGRRRRHDLSLLRIEGGAGQRALPAVEADHRRTSGRPTFPSTGRRASSSARSGSAWPTSRSRTRGSSSFLELHHHALVPRREEPGDRARHHRVRRDDGAARARARRRSRRARSDAAHRVRQRRLPRRVSRGDREAARADARRC